MDIVKKIKPVRASHETLTLRNKIIILLTLIGLVGIIIPHSAEVHAEIADNSGAMVFAIGDYEDYLTDISKQAEKKYTHEQVVAKLRKQLKLADAVELYLAERGSPLAPHANTLIQQNNWKKIVALSNAESSLCRRYPTDTANCWGVGGSDLWEMGENLGQGVVSMNRFLNNYPLRSPQKYAQMPFEKMNGLYKQPAAQHWVDNNTTVYQDLVHIEQGL